MQPTSSRYYGLPTAPTVTTDGHSVRYLLRRFLPASDSAAVISEHLVTEGDRLDNLTARFLGDPLQFWRVADANDAMRPVDLVGQDAIAAGKRLRIPLPLGG